jgi:hypothetical protein
MERTQALQKAHTAEELLAVVQRNAAELGPVNISAAYTCAVKLCRNGVPPQQQPAAVQQLLQHLHQLAEQQRQQCGARQLANIIWSCGRLQDPAAVQLLLPELLQARKLQQALPQEVSSTLWAAATLDLQLPDGAVQQLVQRFVQVLPDTNARNISNTLWAAATLNLQLQEGVAQQLVQRFVQVLPDTNAQAIPNTLWAAATMNLQLAEGAIKELTQHLIRSLPDARPQAISNTLLACGRMQYAPLQLLSALEQQLDGVLAASVPQDLSNIACACGELGYRGKLLPGALLQQAVQLLQDSNMCSFKMQALCNLCWCAAVLDLQQCVPQVLQLAAAAEHMLSIAASKMDFCQLYQVHLWLLDSKLPAPGQGLLGVLSQQQLQQCRDRWEQDLTQNTASAQASDLHRSVFAGVQALPGDTWQGTPVLEQRSADGSLSIDIAAKLHQGRR